MGDIWLSSQGGQEKKKQKKKKNIGCSLCIKQYATLQHIVSIQRSEESLNGVSIYTKCK